MFVPVACLKCGKPFQVPAAAAGTAVACPWCQAETPALPVAGLGTSATAGPDAPLELDDAPPAGKPPNPVTSASPPSVAPTRRGRFPFKTAIFVMLASAVCGVAAFFVVGVARGRIGMPGRNVERIPESAWIAFSPPDQSCSVLLPGTPTEADPLAGFGKRYVTHGWFSGVTTWIGWIELDGDWLQKANAPEAWHLLRPRFDAVLDKQKLEWQATIVRQSTKRFDEPYTMEVEMQLPDGDLVERFIVVAKGPHPRIYYLGLSGRGVAADSATARRIFESFRPDALQP